MFHTQPFAQYPGNYCGTLTPDLSKLDYKVAPAPVSFPNKPPPRARPYFIQKWSFKAKRIATTALKLCNNQESRLLNLPPEMILAIASHLPDASRASLAMTCKALLVICLDRSLFASIELPAEQPWTVCSTRMSKPRYYQPSRWEFLSYLERDLKGKWQLCSECFTLHPRGMFAEFEKSTPPWLQNYYTANASDYRSCRHERKYLGAERHASFAPVGIVDLCPCIKLTLRKKRHLEAHLRQNARTLPGHDTPIAAEFWWHECQHSYCDGAIKLEIKIGIFLYDETSYKRWINGPFITTRTNIFSMPPQLGELGVVIDYRHIYPSTLTAKPLKRSPRMLCPHLGADAAILYLLHCRKRHTQQNPSVCADCHDLQYCPYCRSTVLNLSETEVADGVDGTTTSCYQVERCLDDRLWSIQSIFPFRRRQIPFLRDSPLLRE